MSIPALQEEVFNDAVFKIWDFANSFSNILNIKSFGVQELYAALKCQQSISIGLIDIIFSSIVSILLKGSSKGVRSFFSKINEKDIPKVWPELLSKL